MAIVTVNIRADEVIHDIKEFAGAIEIANMSAVAHIRSGIRGIVIESFEIALDQADFPAIYANHLRRGIRETYPIVSATPDGLVAEYFSIEGLGDYSDLEEGFHYHAILNVDKGQFSVSNPQRVELPYTGEDLYNDFDQRYDFWQAIVAGTPYDVTFGGGINPKTGRTTPRHTKTIQTAGLYNETLRARVNWWGDRYPEWLLLEYGQEFEPSTPPTHFRYLTEQRVYSYMYAIYEEILDSVLAVWEMPTVSRNNGGRLIESRTGRYVPYLPDDLRG